MPVAIGFDYVLVLEWLGERDQRTGADLNDFLPSIGVHSELCVCQSWEDVRQALNDAAAALGTKGVPVVHLETHGSDPWIGPAENIGLGPHQDSGAPWGQLGPLLASLNVAAGFRLLLVSAACWGSGIMAAINAGEHAAPFSCAIGFRTKVGESRLRDSMRELYRSLKRGSTLPESIASAQRELIEGQELRLEIALEIAAKIIRTVYYNPEQLRPSSVGRFRRRRRARKHWEAWFPTYLRELDTAYRFETVIPD